MRVFTVNEILRGEGRIQVVEGRYAAYGQSLVIERGVLSFIGPIDNRGSTSGGAQDAHGQGRRAGPGTVAAPMVTLVSDPPLPDTEKLSWLCWGMAWKRGAAGVCLASDRPGALLSQTESVNFRRNWLTR